MEGEPPSESEPASHRYGTVSYRDCPELFPFYVEQFHKMIQSYPSIYSGYMEYYISEFCEKVERVHLQHLLVMVDYTTLQVVAGISFMLLPGSATLYVEYMLTAPEHRGKGFMKTLFGAMKDQALTTCPDQYKGGFNAIITETRACPTQAKGDYFSDWRGVENTHRALNKIGFYQACFNYIMPGNIQADGKLEEFSEDYVFLVHKDSKALFPSAQTGFVLELDSFYIESFILTCLREIQPYSKNTLEFGADLVKALSVVPLNSCPIRRTVPFYRTDKTYHSDYG